MNENKIILEEDTIRFLFDDKEAAKYVKNDVETTRIAYSKFYTKLKVKKVIFNNPATIIYWSDGSKTVVKCQEGDTYSKETGFVMAYLKKLLGNKNEFNKLIKKWVTEDKTDD